MAAFGSLLEYLVLLPVLAALWAGVLGLRQPDGSGVWWLMAAGVLCSTLSTIATLASVVVTLTSHYSGVPRRPLNSMAISETVGMLGAVLFAIGFALHGQKAARAANRREELEQLTSSMSEEIKRLRQGGPAA